LACTASRSVLKKKNDSTDKKKVAGAEDAGAALANRSHNIIFGNRDPPWPRHYVSAAQAFSSEKEKWRGFRNVQKSQNGINALI